MSEIEPLAGTPAAASAHLKRRLSGFANMAMTYSGVGAAAGIFSLFAFSYSTSGPSMIWGWIVIGLGAGLLALLFAELSSHYPYAGVAYQWSAILMGRRVGWWIGWIYLFGSIWTLTSYYFTLQASFIPLFGLSGTQTQLVALAVFALVVATILNAAGIEILGRFTKYGVIAELGVFTVITVLVFATGSHHDSLAQLTNTAGTSTSGSGWLTGFLGGGVFFAVWVLFSFENGGTLGEETTDAHRKAPRAVLGAWAVTFVAGLLFILAILLTIPNATALVKSSSPVQDVISASAIGQTGTKIYLLLILFISVLGANAFFAGVVRHLFSMARDGALPFAKYLSRTRASNGSPWVAVLVIAVITALPLIASQTFSVLVTGAVAVMYIAYFVLAVVMLVARLKGWPRQRAHLSLGRWGLPLNIIAVIFTGAVMLDLLWPRAATNPNVIGIPVAWILAGAPAIVGLVFYVGFLHKRLHELPSLERPQETQDDKPAAAPAAATAHPDLANG